MSMAPGEPKWRRRKEARPAEITAAAFALFAEKGFAATRLDDVAVRAGVSKGALYLYFETKEDLFRAVVRDSVSPNVALIVGMAQAFDGAFADLARLVLPRVAQLLGASDVGKVAKMVIGEGRNFPEIARHWHAEVVAPALGAMTTLIAGAQARGEVGPGDPRLHAMSLIGPMLMGVLWNETFGPVGAEPVALEQLAAQHVQTALAGMIQSEERA
jgi:AcrR family transcriptional regulator